MTALSDHLFWDVDRAAIDPERHAAWLVKRVLEYGRWRDWQILVEHFGKPELSSHGFIRGDPELGLVRGWGNGTRSYTFAGTGMGVGEEEDFGGGCGIVRA